MWQSAADGSDQRMIDLIRKLLSLVTLRLNIPMDATARWQTILTTQPLFCSSAQIRVRILNSDSITIIRFLCSVNSIRAQLQSHNVVLLESRSTGKTLRIDQAAPCQGLEGLNNADIVGLAIKVFGPVRDSTTGWSLDPEASMLRTPQWISKIHTSSRHWPSDWTKSSLS